MESIGVVDEAWHVWKAKVLADSEANYAIPKTGIIIFYLMGRPNNMGRKEGKLHSICMFPVLQTTNKQTKKNKKKNQQQQQQQKNKKKQKTKKPKKKSIYHRYWFIGTLSYCSCSRGGHPTATFDNRCSLFLYLAFVMIVSDRIVFAFWTFLLLLLQCSLLLIVIYYCSCCWVVGLLGGWVVGLLGCWVVGCCWVVGLLGCWVVVGMGEKQKKTKKNKKKTKKPKKQPGSSRLSRERPEDFP